MKRQNEGRDKGAAAKRRKWHSKGTKLIEITNEEDFDERFELTIPGYWTATEVGQMSFLRIMDWSYFMSPHIIIFPMYETYLVFITMLGECLGRDIFFSHAGIFIIEALYRMHFNFVDEYNEILNHEIKSLQWSKEIEWVQRHGHWNPLEPFHPQFNLLKKQADILKQLLLEV